MRRLPAVVFVAVWASGIMCVVLTSGRLPARMATHFGAAGVADGWMSGEAHARLMLLLVALIPFGVASTFMLLNVIPDTLINLPNREYWLAAPRRRDTLNWMASAGLWFASLTSLFLTGVHLLVLQANSQSPPHLSNAVWVLLAAMLTGVAVLVSSMLRKFVSTTA